MDVLVCLRLLFFSCNRHSILLRLLNLLVYFLCIIIFLLVIVMVNGNVFSGTTEDEDQLFIKRPASIVNFVGLLLGFLSVLLSTINFSDF